jgi:excisionase family DNA binding protein
MKAVFASAPRPLLDIEAVSVWLGPSHRHVRRLVADRRIPYLKVGHYVRFDDKEIAKWIDEQRVAASSDGASHTR